MLLQQKLARASRGLVLVCSGCSLVPKYFCMYVYVCVCMYYIHIHVRYSLRRVGHRQQAARQGGPHITYNHRNGHLCLQKYLISAFCMYYLVERDSVLHDILHNAAQTPRCGTVRYGAAQTPRCGTVRYGAAQTTRCGTVRHSAAQTPRCPECSTST
jgi:hypothetical protein